MPWKRTCAMSERFGFIAEMQRGERSLSELCRVFGISRKTGHKWWARFAQEGYAGLQERSSAPVSHPNAIRSEMRDRLLEVRRAHSDWGPQKVLDYLTPRHPGMEWPAVSTVAQFFMREGLVKARQRQRRSVPFGAPFTIATAPNELWSADFKGQFRMHDARLCYPLTMSDGFSRYLLCCRGLRRPTLAATQPWFEWAFREYGLPAAIRTDNGAPFASTALGGISSLSLWLLKHGVIPERIRPAHPEQNGRHERLHGTLKRACAPQANLRAQQRAFDRFRYDYNCERPHQALGGKCPHSLYRASPRAYPKRLPELQYPHGFVVRYVHSSGQFKWRGTTWYVGPVFSGEPLGLKPVDDAIWQVHVGPLAIALLDLRQQRLQPIATFIEVPTLH
jgi:putative transposase